MPEQRRFSNLINFLAGPENGFASGLSILGGGSGETGTSDIAKLAPELGKFSGNIAGQAAGGMAFGPSLQGITAGITAPITAGIDIAQGIQGIMANRQARKDSHMLAGWRMRLMREGVRRAKFARKLNQQIVNADYDGRPVN